MAQVNYKRIKDAILTDQTLRLEDLNVALITRIVGETNPAGSPSVVPVPIKGMLDLADKFKPTLKLKLKDETGAERQEVVRYYKDLIDSRDFLSRFDPASVALRMESATGGCGLLFELMVRLATLKGLGEGSLDQLASDELAGELKEDLQRLLQFENSLP
jgi:hypothetical protein